MGIDIRDKQDITHEDILGLNFIKKSCRFFFRKHFREGLRSRLMQVLDPRDVEAETKGVIQNGMRWFPLAQPVMMLRIFKERFQTSQALQEEIQDFKMLQKYLPVRHYALSQEFVVPYFTSGRHEMILCGLQEFVEGETLDPWREDSMDRLKTHFEDLTAAPDGMQVFVDTVRASASSFVNHLKIMIHKAGLIPDLAGIGNIRVTADGNMKLVDINNISPLTFDHHIRLDDRDYPVCDKSIEALSKIELHLAGKDEVPDEPIYRLFLDRERMAHVKALEKRFHETTSAAGSYPRLME
jgi:hypothetical protein